jgi:hypothetical protein
MSVSYSDNLEYRKVILRINNSGSSGGNNSEKSPKEITLAEGENAKFGDTEVKVSAIGSDSVSVTIGQDTRTILNGQWENFSGILVEIKGIFYTGVPGESKVVLLVTSGGN